MKQSRKLLLAVLDELSELFPQRRFGQLVANVPTVPRAAQVEGIWESEDNELLTAARRLVERNQGRMEASRTSRSS